MFDSIVIDGREKERIKPAKEFFKDAEVYNLSSADYLFVSDNKTCAFEYKTIFDCINSIIDHRIFRQTYDMEQTYDKSYLVIHGDFTYIKSLIYTFNKRSNVNFNYNQFIGALARLYSEYNVIQITGDFEDVLFLMKKIAEKCFDSKHKRPIIEFKKTDNAVLNFLMCIRGINYKTAKLIVDEYSIKNLNDLFVIVNTEDLTDIKGIGNKTRDLILEAIE